MLIMEEKFSPSLNPPPRNKTFSSSHENEEHIFFKLIFRPPPTKIKWFVSYVGKYFSCNSYQSIKCCNRLNSNFSFAKSEWIMYMAEK